MKTSTKYSLVGLLGAGILVSTSLSANSKHHEYLKSRDEMSSQIQETEVKRNTLGHEVTYCIRMGDDCQTVYEQYKAASNEYDLLRNKYALFLSNHRTDSGWESMIGAPALLLSVFGLGRGLGLYLLERKEENQSKGEQ